MKIYIIGIFLLLALLIVGIYHKDSSDHSMAEDCANMGMKMVDRFNKENEQNVSYEFSNKGISCYYRISYIDSLNRTIKYIYDTYKNQQLEECSENSFGESISVASCDRYYKRYKELFI